jgi:hypothetical protein
MANSGLAPLRSWTSKGFVIVLGRLEKPARQFKVSVSQKHEGRPSEVNRVFIHGLEQAVNRYDGRAKASTQGERRIEEKIDGKCVDVSADELRKTP